MGDMANTAILNNVDHQQLRVLARRSTASGDNINLALVLPTEFEDVQREYPILFRKDANGAFQSVALLGLDHGENLFLNDRGWQGHYVPAAQERGPFLIGFSRHGAEDEPRRNPMIHIDLDHPCVSEKEGEPLFLPHGGNSPYLEHIIRVLGVIHDGMQVSGPMFSAFEEAGLIEPVLVEIKLDDATQYNLPDFYTIGAKKLAGLDGPALEKLNRAGFLRAAFCVLTSLGNVGRLIDLKNRKRRQAPSGTG